MTSSGFTAQRLTTGEVEVLRDSKAVVTTGRRVGLFTQFDAKPNGSFPACGGRELD